VGKRIPTVNYSLTKEIGTYTANGLALVEFKFMTTMAVTVSPYCCYANKPSIDVTNQIQTPRHQNEVNK